MAARVASRWLKASFFNVGDLILYGKYKNKKGRIVGFEMDAKGEAVVEIEPVPKGQKKNQKITLFRIRKAPIVKTATRVATRVRVIARYRSSV